MRQQLEKDVQGTLTFRPDFAPVSASVALYRGTTPFATGSVASYASVSASISGDVGYLTASVDSATGIHPGSDYWVVNAAGRQRMMRAVDVAGTVVTFDQPLEFSVASGTLLSADLSVTLSAADTAHRERRCEALWTVSDVFGAEHRLSQRFDIVRRPLRLSVTEEMIETVWPSFGEYLGRGAWEKHVDYAKQQIALWLSSQQIEPDLVREPEHLARAAAHIVVARSFAAQGKPEAITYHEQQFAKILSMLESAPLWRDEDDDLTVDGSGGYDDLESGPGADQSEIARSELDRRPTYLGIG